MNFTKISPCILLFCLLCSCKTGPDYEPPVVEIPDQFDAAAPAAGTASDVAWWKTFDDPLLNLCIEEALAANHDVQVAFQRVRSARAMRRMESSRFWPDIDARGSYTVDRMSENNPRFGEAIESGVFPRDVEYWDVGFDVTWELDVFGRTQRRVEASAARVEEEEFQRRGLLLSITAEVARNYLEIRGNQIRLKMLEEQIANETTRTDILRLRQESGLMSADQVFRSQSREQQLSSVKPFLEAEIQAGEYRLAVLLGRRPEESIEGLEIARPLPSAIGQVPIGLPSDLLRRRPDILAAERRLAAASAEIGVATAEFFPRFFLTGSPNLQSGDFSSLFNGASSAWIFGPSVTWKLFSGGRNRAQLESAKAQEEQAFIQYEATVNKVLEEVESSLVRYANDAQSLKFLVESVSSQHQNVDIQQLRTETGISDQLEVLDARATWFDARLGQVDQEVLLLTRLVNLYKALGGGWEQAEKLAMNAEPAEQNEKK